MKRTMELFIIIHKVASGITNFILEIPSEFRYDAILSIQEKDLLSIISSPDKAIVKRDKILSFIANTLKIKEYKGIDIIRIKGILVEDDVTERNKFLKVLGRVFMPIKGIYNGFNLNYVRILRETNEKPYIVKDKLVERWYNIEAYSKDVIDNEEQRAYLDSIDDKDLTVSQAKDLITSIHKQFEGTILPRNIILVNMIIDILVSKVQQEGWKVALLTFMDTDY